MKYQFLCVALLAFMTSLTAQKSTQMDTLSYSVGVLVAQNLKQQGVNDLDISSFSDALTDIFENKELKIDAQQAGQLFQSHMQKVQEEKFAVVKTAGEEFLTNNANRAEVKTTPSGLQYEVLKSGGTTKPTAASKVKVHYHGMLIDGKVFDSSVERGEPATFPVGSVIQGWQEVLPMMSVGDKWKVFIPQDLAYGARGAGQDIPPYSALVFEIELLEIM